MNIVNLMEDKVIEFNRACRMSRTARTMKENGITISITENTDRMFLTSNQEQQNILFEFRKGDEIKKNWEMWALVINWYILSSPNVKLSGFNEDDSFMDSFENLKGLELWHWFRKWMNEDEDIISFRYVVRNNDNYDLLYLKAIKSDEYTLKLYLTSESKSETLKDIEILLPNDVIEYANIPLLVKRLAPLIAPALLFYNVLAQCDLDKIYHDTDYSSFYFRDERCSSWKGTGIQPEKRIIRQEDTRNIPFPVQQPSIPNIANDSLNENLSTLNNREESKNEQSEGEEIVLTEAKETKEQNFRNFRLKSRDVLRNMDSNMVDIEPDFNYEINMIY